jgi:hypothetical protein
MNAFSPLKCSILLGALLMTGCSTPTTDSPPDPSMAVPESEADRIYLGLGADRDRFLLDDIRAEILVVDCFDMYCHACQTGAKHVNEFYAMVQEHGLGSRIKFIGLGINNTPLETATFHRKFDVPFPSFPDRKRDVSNQFGRVRLPSILVLRSREGRWEVMHQTTGAFTDPEELFMRILEDVGADEPLPDSQQTAGAACLTEDCPPAGAVEAKD